MGEVKRIEEALTWAFTGVTLDKEDAKTVCKMILSIVNPTLAIKNTGFQLSIKRTTKYG